MKKTLATVFLTACTASAFAASARAAEPTTANFTFACADRPLAHPFFRERPSFNVACSVAVADITYKAVAPNVIWASQRLADEVCDSAEQEIKGLTYHCDFEAI